MTLDYLKSALTQLQQQQLKMQNDQQALHGAMQMVTQLITQEETLIAGGTQPAQGVTGPGV
jgi:hypothetical protein